MTSSSNLLRTIITGVFILFILAIFPAIIFPVAGPGPVPASSPAPASPHAFVVTMAEVPPLEAFPNVTLYKLMSPARAQEKTGTYPITEDLSFVNIPPGEGTLPHILLETPEVMYLIDGTATVCANGSMTEVSAGELVYIPGDTVQSTANTGRVPLRYISLLDPYYTESREIRLNVTTTTDISRDSVPLRTWNRNDTTPLVSFDRMKIYQMVSPAATDHNGLNMTVPFSWAYVTVPATGGSLPHSLNATSEVIYVIAGSGTAHIGNETFALHKGDTLFIPPDTVQSVTNTGSVPLEYLSLLDPYWRPST